MIIEKNRVVSLTYQLHTIEDGVRTLRDEATSSSPLQFLFGAGQLLPLFEFNLQGKKAGDSFEFMIPFAEGYGDYDQSAMAEIPKSAFEGIGQNLDEFLVIGRVLPMKDQDGNQFNGEIIDILDDFVVMDFNHPLAGYDLYFTGTITDVRMATPDEIAHGHVHGHGGYNH